MIRKGRFKKPDTARSALGVFAAMLPEVKINRERMNAAASDPNLLATDLAEYLVKRGTPFREAHEVVGKVVAHYAANAISRRRLNAGALIWARKR
jgi:argininosuccinate lyase